METIEQIRLRLLAASADEQEHCPDIEDHC